MPDILAAGVVAFRPGREVLLVHRPKYDDWSFPKGKLDRGEHATAAAVREVAEETGVHVRLGPPLPTQRYPVARRMKTVHYWTGRVVGDDDVSAYRPNDEIDQVAWVPVADAPERLTYDRDRETLADALRVRRKTHAVVVLRHARARSRSAWRGPDAGRTLLKVGEAEADRLVPLLAAYGVTRVVTSTSTRCVQTVRPYAETAGYPFDLRPRLTEENAAPRPVAKIVHELLDGDGATAENAVLCTHRPVLPLVYDAAGVELAPDDGLAPAEMLVLHVRKGRIVAVERHQPR
ncbi:NUDIX domain-containing protein [Pimelobacter simplex]|uniref:Hydrolase MutT1 n=1 Tax=Nocardioides simplex TaxID=2045 RepID=A0A0A1DNF5_NOCSI|nr:NUDIX hydrolase [Pimelobacter simplex]AIY18926.1 Hydrolase MutT1 [Pimelobacter simplex]MCG8148854.1 NUDIX domain-containing protein [Pimelobacter simplex]GEB14670.1 ADP-ribose pyrophosphatase [Pimelobacter simplex]SFM26992.1 8-oxo-dGTP diphosphatase [Pimelobacter simplex]